MKAEFESICDWCYERIHEWDEITPVEHPLTKRTSFFHEQCAKEAQAEWADESLTSDWSV